MSIEVVHDISDANKQLYLAVVGGRVRARLNGRELGPETRKSYLANLKHDDDDPFALPPDIELSVDDARREWGIE